MKLFDQLNGAGYYCTPALAASVAAASLARPVGGALLYGPAGCGKSQLPQTLAALDGIALVFAQCFPGTREDDLLTKLIPCDKSRSGIKQVDGPVLEAAKLSASGPVSLVLDEWDKTRPSADSFLLDFLQSGRIRFNGHSAVAILANMQVWLTANDEREMSEPLLRRLPRIDFSPLPAALVERALTATHEGHPHLAAAVTLYRRCVMAELPKPATIQELRQLLDAITLLEGDADWDALVYQFVTKSREGHALLAQVEGRELREERRETVKLSAAAYESKTETETPAAPAIAAAAPVMPKPSIAAARQIAAPVAAHAAAEVDLSCAAGILPRTDAVYDVLARGTDDPGDDPLDLPGVARVVSLAGQESILLAASVNINDHARISDLTSAAKEGEIVIVAPLATAEQVMAIPNTKIYARSKREILARGRGIDLRWSSEGGCEIVADLSRYSDWGDDLGLPRWKTDESRGFAGRQELPSAPGDSATARNWGAWQDNASILLPHTPHCATISLLRQEQKAPDQGNEVRVRATIFLPVEGECALIPTCLRLKGVKVADKSMAGTQWGYALSDWSARSISREFEGRRYDSLMQEAWDWAQGEIDNLVQGLNARQAALEAAG